MKTQIFLSQRIELQRKYYIASHENVKNWAKHFFYKQN